MKIRLLTLLACACSVRAQQPEPSPSPLLQGKITIEVNGKKEVLDLTDPVTAARLKGKVIITTEINGQRETRVVDVKDADNLPTPFLWNEKPPVRTGPVTFLGIGAVEVPADVAAQLPLAPETGLLLAIVLPDTPAAAAGLQESDVIHKFEDQILVTPRQLAVLIANRKEGDAVKLTVLRKGEPLTLTATLGKRDVPHTAESPDPVAKVTREILKLEGDAGQGRRMLSPTANPAKREEIIESLIKKGYQTFQQDPTSQKRDIPATQDVRRDVRRALDRLPAEHRPEMERILIESGALPRHTLPAEKQPE